MPVGIEAVLIDRMNVVAVFALEEVGFCVLPEATHIRFELEFASAARAAARTDAGRSHCVLTRQ
jgi:hypothetical protein